MSDHLTGFPICTRLRDTDLRMKEYMIDDEPLVITENEVIPFLKEMRAVGLMLRDMEGCKRQILSGSRLTYAGREVKVI